MALAWLAMELRSPQTQPMATVGKRYAQRTHDKCITRIIDARTGEMLRAMSLAACPVPRSPVPDVKELSRRSRA
jgi:hypothetical protein